MADTHTIDPKTFWKGVGTALIVMLVIGGIFLIATGGRSAETTSQQWGYLRFVVAWLAAIMIAAIGLVLVVRMFLPVFLPNSPAGIDLGCLLSEQPKAVGDDGKCGAASLSRFQFLIFTFVIAFGFLLILITNLNATAAITDPRAWPTRVGWPWPDIPAGVLALLGISAGTATVSKGIAEGGRSERTRIAGELLRSGVPNNPSVVEQVVRSLERL